MPGMSQRLMNTIFKDLKNERVVGLYLDDIIIPTKDFADMLSRTRKVF